MITFTKGSAILQLPCGCNSRKFNIMKPESVEDYKNDLAEIDDFVDNHDKICWSKEGNK